MGAAVFMYLTVFSMVVGDVMCSSPQCIPTRPDALQFTITSKKNITGHWNTLVHLSHDADVDGDADLERDTWEVEVRQNATKVGARQTINIVATITTPPDATRLGPGYELVSDIGYYKLHVTPKTWPAARKICREEGAHLAIVNSEKELRALHGILDHNRMFSNNFATVIAFLGFHDLFVKGQWITLFGDSLQEAGFSEFAPRQPELRENESCGCFMSNQSLHDCVCHDQLSFICELQSF